jgi:hypothetical protein
MPIIRGPIEGDGAIVDVVFGWSAAAVRKLRAGLRPIPPRVAGRALLDTGAEVTCLDASLIRSLGLAPVGPIFANLPAIGGVGVSLQFEAAVTILHPGGIASDHLAVSDVAVLEAPLSVLGYQALIGRDVLARCRLLYDGLANQFDLSY